VLRCRGEGERVWGAGDIEGVGEEKKRKKRKVGGRVGGVRGSWVQPAEF
jgi:hypothetical protein